MKELRLPPCSLQTLISKGHLWRAHYTDVLPAICHVVAYSSSMKRSCENKQQLTRCHIWQWSRSPRGVSANPFLSQREKGEFLQTSGIKTNPGNAKDTNPASIPLQSFSLLYIMQETSFLLDRGQAHICRCTNVSLRSFSIHAWDDFPLAPLLEALKHFPLSATVPREHWGPHLHWPCCVWHRGRFESGNHHKGNPPRGN